jgi:two-component system, OmpR family, sensor kinase
MRSLRNWRNRRRLRLRLTIGFAIAMGAVLGAVAVFVYARAAADLLAVNDSGLLSRAEVIVAEFRASGAVPLDVGASLIETDEAFAQVVDPDGRVLESSPNVESAPLISAADVRDVTGAGFYDRRVAGIDNLSRVLAVPVTTTNGRYVVLVGSSLQDRADQLADLQRSLLIGMPIALVLASVVAWVFIGGALRPVERIRKEAAAIAGSNLTSRLSAGNAEDELARLASTLNAMLDRIAAAFETERSFVDNASHELRTPLAILRAEIDLALTGHRSVDELTATMRSASEEVAHLTRLTENLLSLSRAHGGRISVDGAPIRLRAMLDDLARRHRYVAESSGVSVAVDAPDDEVCIDAARVREALDDVVDNAVRHSPVGGVIVLHATVNEGVVTFIVSDDGPGFRNDILPHAFEPFVGSDTNAGGGAGLGLAIARFIASAHGGDATAVNRAAGGASVALRIRTLD